MLVIQLPLPTQPLSDLSDYSKLSFSGAVPLTGKVGMQAEGLVAELVTKGVIPSKGTSLTVSFRPGHPMYGA